MSGTIAAAAGAAAAASAAAAAAAAASQNEVRAKADRFFQSLTPMHQRRIALAGNRLEKRRGRLRRALAALETSSGSETTGRGASPHFSTALRLAEEIEMLENELRSQIASALLSHLGRSATTDEIGDTILALMFAQTWRVHRLVVPQISQKVNASRP